MEGSRSLPYGDVWFEQVANVHRWLAGDEQVPFERFTGTPGPGDVSYWLAAYYVMKHLLAWKDVPAGVMALLATHSPQGPGRLLCRVWGREALQAIAWWVRECERSTRSSEASVPEPIPSFMGSAQRCGLAGGSDPKHLVGHLGKHRVLNEDSFESTVIGRERRIAMFVEQFEHVPTALFNLMRSAPKGPPSVHVHVTATRFGYVGLYRACWTCGRWFQGPARHHLPGHASP
jgi:hypothetical protein